MRQVEPIGVMEFCKCKKCKDQIDYEIEHMLDLEGLCISRWCANFTDLENVLATMPAIPRSNAEFELRKRGAKTFFVMYFNAPLDPVISKAQVDKFFEEIEEKLKP